MNFFPATNFRDQALYSPVFSIQLYSKYSSAARNICDNKALANLAKQENSRMRIKVGLRYLNVFVTSRRHAYCGRSTPKLVDLPEIIRERRGRYALLKKWDRTSCL